MTAFKPMLTVQEKISIFGYLSGVFGDRPQIQGANSHTDFEIYVGCDFQNGDFVAPYETFKADSKWFFPYATGDAYSGDEYVIVRRKTIDKLEHVMVDGKGKISHKNISLSHKEIKLELDDLNEPLICNVINKRVYLPVVPDVYASVYNSEKNGIKTTLGVKNTKCVGFYKELLKPISLESDAIFVVNNTGYKIPIRQIKAKSFAENKDDKSLGALNLMPLDEISEYTIVPF